MNGPPTRVARASVRRTRRGFTLVEIMTVGLIVSLLTGIAIPAYNQFLMKARAAAVIGDFEVIRTAVLNFNADNHTWPADTGAGTVPGELVNYLPEGFVFDKVEYDLDWENWNLPNGLPKHPETGILLGVSISTENDQLGGEVLNLLGSRSTITVGGNYTFLIEAM